MARQFAMQIGALRANRFAEKPFCSHNVRATRKTPFAKGGFSSETLKYFARIKRFATNGGVPPFPEGGLSGCVPLGFAAAPKP